MKPTKKQLINYVEDKKLAAKKFGVSERTITRWMQSYEIYKPKSNYGCGKLNMEKAIKIRKLYNKGCTKKELSEQYKVTFSTISRIIHNVNYSVNSMANINVVYNPNWEES
jgi:transposase